MVIFDQPQGRSPRYSMVNLGCGRDSANRMSEEIQGISCCLAAGNGEKN